MNKFNWVAQDEDGEVHEYINKPSTEEAAGPWWCKANIGNSRQESEPTTGVVPNWKESLIDLSKNDYIIKKGILMATRKHAALIHAWADGAVIQYQDICGDWCDYKDGETPGFTINVNLRIKPKATTVKFRNYVHEGEIRLHVQGDPIRDPHSTYWIDKEWREVEVEL